MGAHFEALPEGVLMASLDLRYIQVGLNLISVQVCDWLQKKIDNDHQDRSRRIDPDGRERRRERRRDRRREGKKRHRDKSYLLLYHI